MMKRFLDSEFFTDKTTLILRKNWLVLSLPVCVLKGLTIVRFSHLQRNFYGRFFTVKLIQTPIKRQRRTNTWPANGRKERSGAPSGENHWFTGGELSQHLWKIRAPKMYALCATTAGSGVRAAHPFSYPPPLRGGPHIWRAILTIMK